MFLIPRWGVPCVEGELESGFRRECGLRRWTGRRVVYAGVPWFMRSFQGSKSLDRYMAPERCRPMLAHEMLSSEQVSWVKWISNLDVGRGEEFFDNQSHSRNQTKGK